MNAQRPPVAPAPQPSDDTTSQELTRRLLGTGAVLFTAGAAIVAVIQQPIPRGLQLAAGLSCLLIAGLMGWARTRMTTLPLLRTLQVITWTVTLFVLFIAGFVGQGLRTVTLAAVPLMVCLMAVVSGARQALLLAAVAGAGLAGLTWAQWAGHLDAAARVVATPLLDAVLAHALVLACSLALGVAMSRFAQRYRRNAHEREQHFFALLGIAADAYWETDTELRVRAIWRRTPEGSFAPVTVDDPRPAWSMPSLHFDPEVLNPVREAMAQRRRFRDARLHRRLPDGRIVHLAASGEPRLDEAGKFIGYWGLVTDITAEVQTESVARTSEARFRHLFEATPTPLILHREGLVIEANPAAARLFGYPEPQAMVGRDVVANALGETSRVLTTQRRAQAKALALGESLPFIAYRARRLDGQSLAVQATMACVQTEQGPALLSMFIDETQRLGAQEQARRTQSLLAHVVAASPDVITLTDLRTGRYEMVNDTFCRAMGYASEEVIGRTSLELDVWHDPADRERLVHAVKDLGSVQDMVVVFKTKGGERLPLQVSASSFDLEGTPFLVINARDTSDADRSRLERLAILDNASIGIAFTRDQRFMVINKHFEQMMGWAPGEMVGRPARVVWASDEAYAEVGRRFGPQLGRGEQVEFEHLVCRRDGSTFLARLLAKAIDPLNPAHSGTVWIVDDVTEVRQVEAALAKARDDAEAANRAKSAFLANTSHEIRTPLNGLVGLARLAREPHLDDTRRRQYLEQIGESAQALSAVISDILDLSKIEAGKLVLESTPFDLRELLATLHRAYTALADARGLSCTLDIAPQVPQHVRGDPVRVRQILANFLSNGLKFTSSGSLAIHVHVAGGAFVRFEVRDTGTGIEPAHLARLFQPFTQADESTTRRYGGTGLGLSICRELAQRMGGEVGVHSELGSGSTFWAELALPEADLAGEDSEFGGLEVDPLRGAHVLLVEDNPVNMMIGVAMLERWGARVDQACDGAQAVEQALRAAQAGDPFDLALMDVQMPGMSGHEAARTLRRYFAPSRLGIVALTAAALVSEREQALAAGMDDFVTKPIDERRLHGTLVRALNRRAPRAAG